MLILNKSMLIRLLLNAGGYRFVEHVNTLRAHFSRRVNPSLRSRGKLAHIERLSTVVASDSLIPSHRSFSPLNGRTLAFTDSGSAPINKPAWSHWQAPSLWPALPLHLVSSVPDIDWYLVKQFLELLGIDFQAWHGLSFPGQKWCSVIKLN